MPSLQPGREPRLLAKPRYAVDFRTSSRQVVSRCRLLALIDHDQPLLETFAARKELRNYLVFRSNHGKLKIINEKIMVLNLHGRHICETMFEEKKRAEENSRHQENSIFSTLTGGGAWRNQTG
jgi:hypothetical protein